MIFYIILLTVPTDTLHLIAISLLVGGFTRLIIVLIFRTTSFVAAVGLLEQWKRVVGTNRHRPDELLEIPTVFFAVAKSDLNTFLGFVVIGISIHGHRSGVVVACLAFDLKHIDHITGDQHVQIANAIAK